MFSQAAASSLRAKGHIFLLLECALGSVVTGELYADVAEDLDHHVAVGSKDGHTVWLSSIVSDASAVWEELIRSDELPVTDQRIRGTHLSMHGGDSECHGSDERKNASRHECTLAIPSTLHNLIVFTDAMSTAYAFRNARERCGCVSSARAFRVAAPSKE
jgi:hypothetical protein